MAVLHLHGRGPVVRNENCVQFECCEYTDVSTVRPLVLAWSLSTVGVLPLGLLVAAEEGRVEVRGLLEAHHRHTHAHSVAHHVVHAGGIHTRTHAGVHAATSSAAHSTAAHVWHHTAAEAEVASAAAAHVVKAEVAASHVVVEASGIAVEAAASASAHAVVEVAVKAATRSVKATASSEATAIVVTSRIGASSSRAVFVGAGRGIFGQSLERVDGGRCVDDGHLLGAWLRGCLGYDRLELALDCSSSLLRRELDISLARMCALVNKAIAIILIWN